MFNRRAFPDFSDWDDPDGYAGYVYSSNTITEVAYDLFFKKEDLIERYLCSAEWCSCRVVGGSLQLHVNATIEWCMFEMLQRYVTTRAFDLHLQVLPEQER